MTNKLFRFGVVGVALGLGLSLSTLAGAATHTAKSPAAPKPSTAFCTALKSASNEIGKTMPRPGNFFISHHKLSVIQFAEAKYMLSASKIAPTSAAGVYLAQTSKELTLAANINKAPGKLSKSQKKKAEGYAHNASMDFLKFTSMPAALHWCGGY